MTTSCPTETENIDILSIRERVNSMIETMKPPGGWEYVDQQHPDVVLLRSYLEILILHDGIPLEVISDGQSVGSPVEKES